MARKFLHIGGVVAIGFDASEEHMLVVSHAGRGMFTTRDWVRVARDYEVVYPDGDVSMGIGPLDGQKVAVQPVENDTRVTSPSARIVLFYDSGTVEIEHQEVEWP
ncbi:MAG: hypothetical protein HEQ23_13220 [Tepidisphaera sp.]